MARLVEGGLVAAEQAMALIAPPLPVRSLRQSEVAVALRSGRTCYDHLAGGLGVQVTQALVQMGSLVVTDTGFEVTDAGERTLAELGIDVAAARRSRRAFAAPCLDWSERRHHLAGALGSALLNRLLDLGWIRQVESSRAVRVTAVA